MSATDVCDVVVGPGTSYYAKRMITKSVREASENERRALLSTPDKSRRYSWLLVSPTNIARLRLKGAYSILAFAEDDSAKGKDCIDLRDWASRTFVCQPTIGTGDADPRNYFITWRVFHERQNLRYVYLPRTLIERAMRVAGVGMAEAEACLVEGPPDSRVVTHAEFSKMQAAIRSFLRNASTLQSRSIKDFESTGLDQKQAQVAKGIVETPFSVLHGGAGTGKSTLIAAVVNSFLACGMPVLCLAPTHRAKKNLAKRLPAAANVTTVDSYIKSSSNAANKTSPSPGAGAGAGGSADKVFIFIDEASMVDLEKMALLARTRTSAPGKWQICMTGDHGQLEPIDRGEMFRTMIHNGGAHIFELLKCYRAENESLLSAQRAIRDGRVPQPSECVRIDLLSSDKEVERTLVPYIHTNKGSVQYIAWTNKMCAFVNAHVQKQLLGSRVSSSSSGGANCGRQGCVHRQEQRQEGAHQCHVGNCQSHGQRRLGRSVGRDWRRHSVRAQRRHFGVLRHGPPRTGQPVRACVRHCHKHQRNDVRPRPQVGIHSRFTSSAPVRHLLYNQLLRLRRQACSKARDGRNQLQLQVGTDADCSPVIGIY